MDNNIVFEKKSTPKKKILIFLLILISIFIVFILSFYYLNPPYFMKYINNINNNDTYRQNFIVTINPKDNNDSINPMSIIINNENNKQFSESYQSINLTIDDKNYSWGKLYKFNTLIEKTPYDSRYFKINDFPKYKFSHNYEQMNSKLLNISNNLFLGNSNFVYSNVFFKNKSFLFNTSDKLKYNYEINPQKNSNIIFKNLMNSIYNSKNFNSFFNEDDYIQKKLELKNETKKLKDIFYSIKENSTVNSSTLKYSVKLNHIDDINYTFDITFKNNTDQNINLILNIDESLLPLNNTISPENNLQAISLTDINNNSELKKKITANAKK